MNERRLSSLLDAIPDAEPTPATVERHRRALRDVIDQPNASNRKFVHGSRWGRVAVAAGFVILIASAVTVMTMWSSPDRRNEISANRHTQTPPPAAAPDGGCAAFADEHPVDVPSEFSGPEDAAVADSPNPPTADQTVRTWKSGTTEIEARWPVDPTFAASLPGPKGDPSDFVPPFPGAMPSMGLTSSGGDATHPTSTGRSYVATFFRLNGLFDTPCESVQVLVFDQDPNKVGPLAFNLNNHPFESGVPLVTSTQNLDVAPTAIACPATGEKAGGPVSGFGEFPTPEDALAMWLETEPGHARDGWVENKLPDGSIAYAHIVDAPPRPELGWVAVVHAAKSGEGWTIDYWEGSAC